VGALFDVLFGKPIFILKNRYTNEK